MWGEAVDVMTSTQTRNGGSPQKTPSRNRSFRPPPIVNPHKSPVWGRATAVSPQVLRDAVEEAVILASLGVSAVAIREYLPALGTTLSRTALWAMTPEPFRGRPPSNIAYFLADPVLHRRATEFFDAFVDRANHEGSKHEKVVEGYRAYRFWLVEQHRTDERPITYVDASMIAVRYFDGHCELAHCNQCATPYLRSTLLLRVKKRRHFGECFVCNAEAGSHRASTSAALCA